MDELQKLLKRAPKKDREAILSMMTALRLGQTASLRMEKLKNSNLYRIRVGRYRIMYSMDKDTKKIVIETVRLRNENTYK